MTPTTKRKKMEHKIHIESDHMMTSSKLGSGAVKNFFFR